MKQVGVVVVKVSHKNPNKNFFDIFGFEVTFDIDIKLLDKKYTVLSSQFHPDRYRSSIEKSVATNKFIDIQKAYICLKNVITRVEHIFFLYNVNYSSSEQHMTQDRLEEYLSYQEKFSKNVVLSEIELFKSEVSSILLDLKRFLNEKNFEDALKYYYRYKFLHKFLYTLEN